MGCRHCGHTPASRPRGLCWNCYYTPGIRDQYTTTSRYGRRGVEDSYGRFHLPSTPTQAMPGTPEKIAVMIVRAMMRESLWHPLDAPALQPVQALSATALSATA
jgi:hypothetical protein